MAGKPLAVPAFRNATPHPQQRRTENAERRLKAAAPMKKSPPCRMTG
jgi:hypothetical protein